MGSWKENSGQLQDTEGRKRVIFEPWSRCSLHRMTMCVTKCTWLTLGRGKNERRAAWQQRCCCHAPTTTTLSFAPTPEEPLERIWKVTWPWPPEVNGSFMLWTVRTRPPQRAHWGGPSLEHISVVVLLLCVPLCFITCSLVHSTFSDYDRVEIG